MPELEFGKVITAVVTPFKPDLSIDFNAYAKLLKYLGANSSDSIIVCGTTGESPTLTESEKLELLEFTIKKIDKKIKVIFGAGTNDTKKSIELAKRASQLGADGLLIVAPYYNKPNQRGILAHFGAIAKSVDLPIIVYNIPGRTGITIENSTIMELNNSFTNIKYLKDSTGNLAAANDLNVKKSDSLTVYSGDDDLTLPFLRLGAVGVISVASHIIGNGINDMINAFNSNNLTLAKDLHNKFLPLFKNLFIEPNPVCVKYALSKLNIIDPYVRLPLVELAPESKKIIDTTLDNLNCLKVKV